MVRKTISLFILIVCNSVIFSQDVVFKVEVTTDTLYYGNRLGVKYTIENTQGDFEPPSFDGFEIVGGPNVASQFTMINGEVSQSSSYEYVLFPVELSSQMISPASLTNGEEIIHSESVNIVILDNPEGIQQSLRKYGVSKMESGRLPDKKMSKSDSLRMKLKKIKAKKI